MTPMPPILGDLNANLSNLIFALALTMSRIFGFFSLSPFFSKTAMSASVRLGVIAAVSIIVVPSVYTLMPDKGLSTWLMFFLLMKELALGLFLGVLIWLPVRGLEIAGVIADTQRGATQSQSFDAIFSSQTTPTALLFAQIFAGYFFAAGGFIIVMTTLYKSFRIWPPLDPMPEISHHAITLYVQMAGLLFASSVILIAPIAGFMLVADIAIAFLARSAQSLNALTLGMPVKSAILIGMLIYYIKFLYPQLMNSLEQALDIMMRVLGS